MNTIIKDTALFNACIEKKLMKDGRLEIHCINGLWCVTGIDHKEVTGEAWRYWRQYLQDGEYNDILRDLLSPNMTT